MPTPAWPAVPRPGELVSVPLPEPPMLLAALGCPSERRWIALWWGGGSAGEPFWTDGTRAAAAYAPAWLALTRDSLFGRIVLDPYELADDPLRPTWDPPLRLVVDRVAGTLAIGRREDVEVLLTGNPDGPSADTADPRRAPALVEAMREWIDALLDWVDTRLQPQDAPEQSPAR